SLGNLILVSNLRKAYTPDAIRLMLLSHHYRQPWEYTEADMQAAEQRARALTLAVTTSVKVSTATGADTSDDEVITAARQRFCQALDDDFSTPAALAALDALAAQTLAAPTLARLRALRELGDVLGLRLELE
ncbi:MAG TPA: DALR domain-containing protein, partial [Ktedonobacterales bacterium]|nr:DALR domain-containing protein [Ktedonobacterales bacterium]